MAKVKFYKALPEPRVLFTPLAFSKQKYYTEYATGEAAWYGFVEELGNDKFLILDLVLPKQDASFGSVDMSAEAQLDLAEEIYKAYPGEEGTKRMRMLRYEGHSHVNMDTGPSTTDLKQYEAFHENMRAEKFIFGISNKKGDLNIMFYDYTHNVVYENMNYEVLYEEPEGLAEACKEEITTKVVQARSRIGYYDKNGKYVYTGEKTRTVGFSDESWESGTITQKFFNEWLNETVEQFFDYLATGWFDKKPEKSLSLGMIGVEPKHMDAIKAALHKLEKTDIAKLGDSTKYGWVKNPQRNNSYPVHTLITLLMCYIFDNIPRDSESAYSTLWGYSYYYRVIKTFDTLSLPYVALCCQVILGNKTLTDLAEYAAGEFITEKRGKKGGLTVV